VNEPWHSVLLSPLNFVRMKLVALRTVIRTILIGMIEPPDDLLRILQVGYNCGIGICWHKHPQAPRSYLLLQSAKDRDQNLPRSLCPVPSQLRLL
jgi:hypothetical protein